MASVYSFHVFEFVLTCSIHIENVFSVFLDFSYNSCHVNGQFLFVALLKNFSLYKTSFDLR